MTSWLTCLQHTKMKSDMSESLTYVPMTYNQ